MADLEQLLFRSAKLVASSANALDCSEMDLESESDVEESDPLLLSGRSNTGSPGYSHDGGDCWIVSRDTPLHCPSRRPEDGLVIDPCGHSTPSVHSSPSSSLCSEPAPPAHRFDAHPLGREELQKQQQQIRAFHRAAWEKHVTAGRQAWTAEISAASAKGLVEEAAFLERNHLREQLEWLDMPASLRRPSYRFGEKFLCPNGSFPREAVSDPARHRDVVVNRLAQLETRWKGIHEDVDLAIRSGDDISEVMVTLSGMNVAVEGQQAPEYGIDTTRCDRRAAESLELLAEVAMYGNGFFLRETLPAMQHGAHPPQGPKLISCTDLGASVRYDDDDI